MRSGASIVVFFRISSSRRRFMTGVEANASPTSLIPQRLGWVPKMGGAENGVRAKRVNILPTRACAATTHGGQGGERITGLIYPTKPRVGLFGVHDGKRFAEVLPRSETFVSRVRES